MNDRSLPPRLARPPFCIWQKLLLAIAFLSHCNLSPATNFYVSPFGSNVPPYAGWSTAATNIQDAIDAASAGDVVWVTNGVYSSGGKVMAGDLTNRVVLDKALTVQSVNGPFVTTIQGAGAINGASAVRCAWLTNAALLKGFTIQGGATRDSTSGDSTNLQSGGGVWCTSSNAFVRNCLINSNAAASLAGGAYQGTLNGCFVNGNLGVGSFNGNLINCTVVSLRDWRGKRDKQHHLL